MRLFSGQRAFVLQRLSALLMLAYVAGAALWLALGPPATFAQWRAWSAHPLGAAALLLLSGAVLAHAWVGVRDVVLDYVKPIALRLAVLAGAGAGLVGLAGWTALILAANVLGAP
jgi:succinate dehydrogenase / fumarate reductase, membrane anchor subunit